MFFPTIRRGVGAVAVLIGTAGIVSAADDPRPRIEPGKSALPTAQRPGAARPGAARGPLPDPALLDGSTQPVEKKSEHGMIGEFELPGDENARGGKVGGPQNPNQQGGGQQNTPPTGLPQGGGAAGQQQNSPGQPPQQGGGGAQGGEQSAQQGGGAQAGGQQGQAGGNSGAGDPGAQPQGIQVSEIGGPQGAQQPGDAGQKPQAVAIGDKGMRIDPAAPQPGVVGSQQQQAAGHTQQHEKGTGSGGKGSGGSGSGNRVEKGRAIPAGL